MLGEAAAGGGMGIAFKAKPKVQLMVGRAYHYYR